MRNKKPKTPRGLTAVERARVKLIVGAIHGELGAKAREIVLKEIARLKEKESGRFGKPTHGNAKSVKISCSG